MKVSIPVASLAILCALAYFEQASSSPVPKLGNFFEDIDVKIQSVVDWGKRIHKNPKGEWRNFLENCISNDVLAAGAEGADRNKDEGATSIAVGAIRKAVAKCARKLDVYVKQKKGEQPIESDSGSNESVDETTAEAA